MTNIEYDGKHIKSPEDLTRLIKDAKWQVKHYTEEVQRASDTLYTRQLVLESLYKQQSDLLESEQHEKMFSASYLDEIKSEINTKNNV